MRDVHQNVHRVRLFADMCFFWQNVPQLTACFAQSGASEFGILKLQNMVRMLLDAVNAERQIAFDNFGQRVV